MAKVLGLGGVFYKAADPQAVRQWYADVLDFELTAWGSASFSPPAGTTQQWTLFSADSDYFAPSSHPFMINLIVDDMEGLLERARNAGAEILGQQDEPYGKFAWLMDPAGVKVELWQPL